jgi:hypothetical protein
LIPICFLIGADNFLKVSLKGYAEVTSLDLHLDTSHTFDNVNYREVARYAETDKLISEFEDSIMENALETLTTGDILFGITLQYPTLTVHDL